MRLIDAEEAIRSIVMISYSENDEAIKATAKAIYVIEHSPTIEPERKKGRWINHHNDDGHNIADCDQCGNAIQWFDDEIPRYCCMCGADMRGESE